MSACTCPTCRGSGTHNGNPCERCRGAGVVPGPHYVTGCQTPGEQIVFLLRHMGPQRERDLLDSLGVPIATIRHVLAELVAQRRIERHAPDRWRLIPARSTPTLNPGTP